MAKVNYSKQQLHSWQGAVCKYPLFPFLGIGTCRIIIHPKYIDDKGILEHELQHEKQYKKVWNHSFKYEFNKSYRLECELEAYSKQIKEYKYKNFYQCEWIIKALMNNYDLKMNKDYIREKVFKIWKDIHK